MFCRTVFLLALVCLAALTPARAEDAKGNFDVWGVGNLLCRDFAGKMGQPAEESWIGGYLTAYNRLTPNTWNLVPLNDNISSVEVWLGTYCKQHPNEVLALAVAAYTKEMMPRRMTAAPGK